MAIEKAILECLLNTQQMIQNNVAQYWVDKEVEFTINKVRHYKGWYDNVKVMGGVSIMFEAYKERFGKPYRRNQNAKKTINK